MPTPLDILRNTFGYQNFRYQQEAIIQTVLEGRDSLVLLPTGGGKSLCYQLPALLLPGLTIVVSPLIALMKDQVDTLKAKRIRAAYLSSTMDLADYQLVIKKLRQQELKLLYVAPERLFGAAVSYSSLNASGTNSTEPTNFWRFLTTILISLFAIDEAHCISEWGHEFRPGYRLLSAIKIRFPQTPLIALTATANKKTMADITDQLKLKDPLFFMASFNRPTIHYRVEPHRQVNQRLRAFLGLHARESGIIYTHSRRSADRLAEKIRRDGFSTLPYHAGLTIAKRNQHQDEFLKNEIQIMVATLAFGMGIDKPDVRYVVHYDLPSSLEQYYQETGRAGRDGASATALLFYNAHDFLKLKRLAITKKNRSYADLLMDKLITMANYCEGKRCRRQMLLAYFGEAAPNDCENCDNCLK